MQIMGFHGNGTMVQDQLFNPEISLCSSRMYRNYILAQFSLFVLFGLIQRNMVICFIMFLLIFNVLINIHEYAN